MKGSKLRIIHLSDFHYVSEDSNQTKVVVALCDNLGKISAEKHIDTIVFSGDFASKGKVDSATVNAIVTDVIKPIRNAISYEVDFFICPGNHDVDLKGRDEVYSPIFEKIATPNEASKLIDKACSKKSEIWSHLNGYIELARCVSPGSYENNPIFYTKKFTRNNVTFGFASLNSAWLTRGGGNQDYGRLFLGERQIDLALSEISDCEIKIAVMHHSVNWLHPLETNVVQRVLATNFHAVLCGHNHENNASSIVSNIGSIFVSNAGCLYQTREYFNGFSILDLDLENRKWILNAREYFSQRDKFDVSSRFSEGGVCEFNMTTELAKSLVIIPASVITEVQERASSKLLSYAASDVAPKQIGAMFVDPVIGSVSEKQSMAGGKENTAEYFSLSQLAVLSQSLLIVGKPETGKTILLHHIATNRFVEFHKTARIGLVLDMATLVKQTEASMLEQLVETTGGEMRKRDIIELLNEGKLLVCIDNLQMHSEKLISLVKAFCEKYPKVKFIIASSEEVFDLLRIDDAPPNLGIPFRRVFIHSFRRKQIREMTQKWFCDSSPHATLKFELVNQLLARLNVPTTPFLVSVLLWVLEQRPNASPVNQAAAIEILIDGLLEKFKESKSRMNFDSNIQKHFLSDFSVHLDEIGVEWIPAIDFDQFLVNYFKRKGLVVSTSGFLDELLRKGLLYSYGDRVAFKFDCFRAYFLAIRFFDNTSLWQRALSVDGIHRYTTELDLFTGLHRDRRDVLEASVNLCKELVDRSGFNVDLSHVEKFGNQPLIINGIGLDSLEKDVLGDAYDSNDREARLLEMEHPSLVSVDHEEARKRSEVEPSTDQLLFFASLRVLSIVVRNSELIDDAKLKKDSLVFAIEYWAKILISVVELAMNSPIEGQRFREITGFKVKDEDIRRILGLVLPQAIVSVMSESLATPKLQTFLAEIGKEDAPLMCCLASLAALDGGEKDGYVMVQSVLKRFGKNTLISQIIFFKLLSTYHLRFLEGSKIADIRDCLAEAFATLRGSSGKEGTAMKVNFLATLDKNVSVFGASRRKND